MYEFIDNTTKCHPEYASADVCLNELNIVLSCDPVRFYEYVSDDSKYYRIVITDNQIVYEDKETTYD